MLRINKKAAGRKITKARTKDQAPLNQIIASPMAVISTNMALLRQATTSGPININRMATVTIAAHRLIPLNPQVNMSLTINHTALAHLQVQDRRHTITCQKVKATTRGRRLNQL